MNAKIKNTLSAIALMSMAACGGGGDGGGHGGGGASIGSGGSSTVLYYPYETVYGDVCTTQQASPGCTFDHQTGLRIKVTADPDYNAGGKGSDDLWYATFDSTGTKAAVYDEYGRFQYYANASEFAGYIGGNTIGVGTSGLYWENVAAGTYWLGKNGVLYSANKNEGNYGQAINDKTSSEASDTNFSALKSEANKKLVEMASDKLVKEYGFQKDKATAVASALNSWAVAGAERGQTSAADMDKTFKSVFGVKFSDALSAVKELQTGSTAGMSDMTNRSAAALGLKPAQAQKFIKGMYRKALASWGYDVNSVQW
jgi:hypothetical protein